MKKQASGGIPAGRKDFRDLAQTRKKRIKGLTARQAASGRVSNATAINAKKAVKGRKNALKSAARSGNKSAAAQQRAKMGDTLVRQGLATRNAKGVAVLNRSTNKRVLRSKRVKSTSG